MVQWLVKLLLSIGLVSSAIFALLTFAPPISLSSVNTQKTDLFTVSGDGKVTVVPDTGIVNIGISVSKADVKTAQTGVNQVMDKITTDLKALGIESKDIKTQNYSIYPQYDYNNGLNRITGYHVNSTLVVTVRQLDKVNSVIDKATADGANTIGNISLTVDETRQKELLQQARDEAVKEAKAKASSLAKSAGINLGRIVNVQESGSSAPRPVYYDMAKSVAPAGMGGGAETAISAGSTDISTSVTLYYEVR